MTGIERLRDWAEDMRWDFGEIGNRWAEKMNDIADQIEREREQEFAALFDARVGEEIDICELFSIEPGDDPLTALSRHIEGQNDTIENLKIELGECDVSAAWVREHGGLSHVKAEWSSRVPRDLYERRRQRLLDHIAECETALGRRRRSIEELGRTIEFFQLNNSNFRHLLADVAERLGFTRYGDDYEPEDLLDALDRRLMPEGCEWPRYESGEPVRIGGAIADELGHAHEVTSVELYEDGADLHWNPAEPEECVWVGHGEPVRRPAKPEPSDSWERWRSEFMKPPCVYCRDILGVEFDSDTELDRAFDAQIQDMERRVRALAERERGE